MTLSAHQVAECVTFQSFANCYAREIDPGLFRMHRGIDGALAECLEWRLPIEQAVLRAEVVSRSLCGPHHFGRVFLRRDGQADWHGMEPMSALFLLVHEAYGQLGNSSLAAMRRRELELLFRVLDSYQATAHYLDAQRDRPAGGNDFITAEQSLVYGHWLHPTPKSRQGMTNWQQEAYSPELGGMFRLVYFAAHVSLVRQAAADDRNVPDIIRALAGRDAEGFRLDADDVVIPMHPLQAQALLLDPDIRALQERGLLRCLGPAGAPFTATSSVRTVYSPEHPWMLKFSLPVQITNSVRLNRRAELETGVTMARLFAKTGFCARHPRFNIIHDPAYITLDLPGRSESGFEVIFRENPFIADAGGAITVAALTAEPVPGRRSRLGRIIDGLASSSNKTRVEVARRWFGLYLDCVLTPLVSLYDELGIALEAHQQNSLLDVTEGYPRAYYYRDNQGFYLSNRYKDALNLHVPEAQGIASLYYDDDEIQDRFAYYLIVNQIFSVISRMGHDGLIEEDALVAFLRERLEHFAATMTGSGRDFSETFLRRPTIAAKANLMTRVFDIDELEARDEKAIYTRLANPVCSARGLSLDGVSHAVPS